MLLSVCESSLSFFLREKGVRLGLVVEGEDGRPGLALDDLSTTTHPLQYRSSELDRQGTGVCVRPRSVSTSWSGFGYSFIHSKFVAHCLTEGKGSPFCEGAPLLRERAPFGRACSTLTTG